MTHTNLGHVWKCNVCEGTDFSEEEYMPDGWWSPIKPVGSEVHYCSEECLFKTMTPEEIEHFNNTPAMA